MSWRDYWNRDTPIYVNERHKLLHYRGIAEDIAALVPSRDARVLDHGCGEALAAERVAAAAGQLFLCDAAPLVRERLAGRFSGHSGITVLAPAEVEALPDGTLDLVVANSLFQYLDPAERDALLGLWRRKLRDDGRLVVADIIPPDVGAVTDARALLAFAAKGGFLVAALTGLVRTALSDYRTLRKTLGLARYREAEMLTVLAAAGYRAERRFPNIGHNPARMTFVARPDQALRDQA